MITTGNQPIEEGVMTDETWNRIAPGLFAQIIAGERMSNAAQKSINGDDDDDRNH